MLHANTIPLAQSQFGLPGQYFSYPSPRGKIPAFPGPRKHSNLTNYSRGVRAEFALECIAVVRRDLGLGDELGDLVSNAPREIPHITVALQEERWLKTPGLLTLCHDEG